MTVDLKDFQYFYEMVDEFFTWLAENYPDTMRYIYQKWLRSDPPNLRTWAKNIIVREGGEVD